MANIWIILASLPPRRRFALWGLLGLALLSSLAETATIALVVPLISIGIGAAAPDIAGFGILAYGSLEAAVLWLVLAVLVSGGLRLLLLILANQQLAHLNADLQGQLFRRAIHMPYAQVLERNSAETINSIDRGGQVVDGFFAPVQQAFAGLAMVVTVGGFLVWLDSLVTLGAIGAVVAGYILLGRATTPVIRRASAHMDSAAVRRIAAMQEAAGGMRDIILQGQQAQAEARFLAEHRALLKGQRKIEVLVGLPGILVDTLAITVIALAVYFLAQQSGGLTAALPIIGALVLGVRRIAPAANMAWHALAALQSNAFQIQQVAAALKVPVNAALAKRTPLEFQQGITFDRVSFNYRPTLPTLREVSFSVPKGAHLGIYGPTGSGKSTVLDLLAGLLLPDSGTVMVDGHRLTPDRIPHWQAALAYVPQAIHLKDASLAENIALGAGNAADPAKIKAAVQAAQLEDFAAKLPEGLDTRVGERGIRLSGGQRQRIGIARALYLGPQVLILDEATSALDPQTETRVMRAITAHPSRPTIITVAHRPTTLAHCSHLLNLSNGRIVDDLPA